MPPRYSMDTEERLASPCGSKAEFRAWATSYFAQRQEVVKLVCVPVTQDSGSEEVGVTCKAYAYCMKHTTEEKAPCKVCWRVQGKAGMMQAARIANQVDGVAGLSQHAPLPLMSENANFAPAPPCQA